MIKVDLTVTAVSDEDLKDFLILLRKINECGNQGMNRSFTGNVDGDGSGQYNFDIHFQDKTMNITECVILDEEENNKVANGEADYTFSLGE